jgi:hypothetical protein
MAPGYLFHSTLLWLQTLLCSQNPNPALEQKRWPLDPEWEGKKDKPLIKD